MWGLALVLGAAALAGCGAEFGPRAKYGITFYCPGIGNMDLGDEGIRRGLEHAGYRGQVARLSWSYTFNPAIDQEVRIIARLGGKRLAALIQRYLDEYPGRPVNVVGLSAGTGVAVWAVEALKPEYKVDNVVLLSSSLNCRYDVTTALERVRGRIFNYHSRNDAVLAGPMRVFGSIDGVYLEEAAGAIGLRVPEGCDGRVVNVGWRPDFQKYGYFGGHFDSTSAEFVGAFIAPELVPVVAVEPPRTGRSTPLATTVQDALPD